MRGFQPCGGNCPWEAQCSARWAVLAFITEDVLPFFVAGCPDPGACPSSDTGLLSVDGSVTGIAEDGDVEEAVVKMGLSEELTMELNSARWPWVIAAALGHKAPLEAVAAASHSNGQVRAYYRPSHGCWTSARDALERIVRRPPKGLEASPHGAISVVVRQLQVGEKVTAELPQLLAVDVASSHTVTSSDLARGARAKLSKPLSQAQLEFVRNTEKLAAEGRISKDGNPALDASIGNAVHGYRATLTTARTPGPTRGHVPSRSYAGRHVVTTHTVPRGGPGIFHPCRAVWPDRRTGPHRQCLLM